MKNTFKIVIVICCVATLGLTLSSCKTKQIVQDFSASSIDWYPESPGDDYSFYNINCIGSKKYKTVYFSFSMKNNTANKTLNLWLCEAFIEIGKMFSSLNDGIVFSVPNTGNSVSGSVDFPTDKYVNFTVKLNDVPPSAEKITNLRMRFLISKPNNYSYFFKSFLIVKDIPIYWKD